MINSILFGGANQGCTTNVYGSNNVADYNTLTNQVPTTGVLLVSTTITNNGQTVTVNNLSLFSYIIIIFLYRSTYTYPVAVGINSGVQINGGVVG